MLSHRHRRSCELRPPLQQPAAGKEATAQEGEEDEAEETWVQVEEEEEDEQQWGGGKEAANEGAAADEVAAPPPPAVPDKPMDKPAEAEAPWARPEAQIGSVHALLQQYGLAEYLTAEEVLGGDL